MVSGSLTGSILTVGDAASPNASATLLGRGTIGVLNLGATAANTGARVNPGDASGLTGIMNSGSFTQTAGARLVIELGGLVAGLGSNGNGTNGYDRLSVTGDISLAGDLEGALVNGFDPQDNVDAFFILVNNGIGLTTGRFSNTTNNTISFGGQPFAINYSADFELNDPFSAIGNDVALIAVPEPGTAAILLATTGLAVGLRRKRNRR
jgi:hypothetical protein